MISQLLLGVFAATVVLFLGGVALTRRFGWPLFIPGISALCVSIITGICLIFLAQVYFSRSRPNGVSPNAIPWVENLGAGLVVATVAFFLAFVGLFLSALIPPIRRALDPRARPTTPNHAMPFRQTQGPELADGGANDWQLWFLSIHEIPS